MKEKNKRKTIIIIFAIIVILAGIYIFSPMKIKGYITYGIAKCECGRTNFPCGNQGGPIIKCILCGDEYMDIWTTKIHLCSECAQKTGRCVWCGGIK